jgi:hypothetical protein
LELRFLTLSVLVGKMGCLFSQKSEVSILH